MINLGSSIRQIRETQGLTQRAAAKVLRISDVHLCNVENGRARPSAELLAEIEAAWGVDVYIYAWCMNGNVSELPAPVRTAMQQLTEAWKAELGSIRRPRIRTEQGKKGLA